MGKAQYLLQRDLRREEADIQKKYKKRGLWSKVGMGLGGLLAMGLTAGTAAPVIAGLMSAGGTFVGGKLGDIAARQTGARIKGRGKFFQGQREDIVSRIGEDIWAGSLKAGMMAGMTQLGAGLKFGKEGLSVSMPGVGAQVTKEGVTKTAGFKFGDIFKPKGGFTKDTFWGRLGESLDPRIGESYLGGKVSSHILGKQLQEMGEGAIGTTKSIAGGTGKSYLDIGPPPARVAGARARSPIATEDIARMVEDANYAAMDVGEGAMSMLDTDIGPIEKPGPAFERRDFFGPSGKEPLSSSLNWRDADIKQTDEFGRWTSGTQHFGTGSGQSVAAEIGQKSAFSQALDAEDITPLELRGRPSIDLPELPSRRLPTQRISSMEYGGVVRGYEPTSHGSGEGYTSNFPVGESADIVKDQGLIGPSEYAPFNRESMLNRQATARYQGTGGIPTGVSGSGTDFTGTSAWEGVGESFPVPSPDMVGDIGEPYTQSPAYDYRSVLDRKRQGRLETLQWQDRLFGR